jgi:outer membrane receptor protein involved in Fe transport
MDALAMKRAAVAPLAFVALLCAAQPAWAQQRRFDVDAGRLSETIPQLARQAGIGIAVSSDALWRARGRGVHGTLTTEEALARLLKGTGSRAVRLNETSWRIEPVPAPPRRTQPPPVTTAPEADAAEEVPIIVTASKLDQSYDKLAAIARIIGEDDLGFGAERGTDSILTRLASVASTHLGSGRNKLFIRGIADSSFTGPTQSTVGEYIGDLRLSYNAPDPDLRLYDIDRVEILEGSQGTLYGAGSLSGIIRLVPNDPDATAFSLGARMGASLTQHGKPGGDIAATINLPLASSGHALRVTAFGITEGGYIDNPVRHENDGNQTRIAGGRAVLRLDPGDGWTVDIGGIYQATLLDDAQYADRSGSPLTRGSAVVQDAQSHYAMALAVVRKDWGSIRFQSSNAFVKHTLSERFDAAPNGAAPNLFVQHNRTEMLTSETRLWRPVKGGIGWLVGFSAIQNRTEQRRLFEQALITAASTGVTNDISEFTAYGKITVEPWRGFILGAGGRLTNSELGGAAEDVQLPVVAMANGITARRTEREFLPSADALLRVTNAFTLFARFEESFRPGGLAVEGGFVRRFRNDHVANWEVGLRWGRQGAPIAATFSLAHTDWYDIQADFIDSSGLPTTANIGDGRITSIAATLALRPTSRLRIDLSAVHNRSRVVALTPEVAMLPSASGIGLPATGSSTGLPGLGAIGAFGPTSRIGKIPNVADQAVQGSVDYRLPVGGHELRLGGWVKYIGPSRLGIGPLLGDEQGDYVDTGLAARFGNDQRGITLTVTNLFDSKGNRFALGTPFDSRAAGFVTPQRPRTINLSVDLAF